MSVSTPCISAFVGPAAAAAAAPPAPAAPPAKSSVRAGKPEASRRALEAMAASILERHAKERVCDVLPPLSVDYRPRRVERALAAMPLDALERIVDEPARFVALACGEQPPAARPVGRVADPEPGEPAAGRRRCRRRRSDVGWRRMRTILAADNHWSGRLYRMTTRWA